MDRLSSVTGRSALPNQPRPGRRTSTGPKQSPAASGAPRPAEGRAAEELLEKLLADQAERWQRGDRVPARTYLQQHPALACHELCAADLIYQEYLLRQEEGSAPPFEEYLAHYPSLAPVLWQLHEAGQVIAQVLPLTDPEPCPADGWGDYEILGEIDRGGVGAVLRGRDRILGRDLAIKVLLPEHRDNPALVRRFVSEAEVTSQLQHPGVVPVYETGWLADGQPYFTMKLVQGQTLAALLGGRGDPREDRPRFLAIFQQVCQTLAYAHSHGVIHRDLKPSNVMVGAFGEVQVMDWGLSKVLTREAATTPSAEGSAGEGAVRTRRPEAPGEASRAGTVLGTLAYMAPEQARGEVDQLDARCDVFGLGALLCEILTGQPPYPGPKAPDSLHRQASQGDLTEALARLEACGTEQDLLRLAQRCLARDPEDRPRDAGVVAREMTAFLASVQERLRAAELVQAAERERTTQAKAKARSERWVRRLAAALVPVVLGLGLLGYRHGFLKQQARQQVEDTLRRLPDLRKQFLWDEAKDRLRGAEKQVNAFWLEDLRPRVQQEQKDLDMAARLDKIRLDKALIVDGKLNLAGAALAYRAAFQDYRLDVNAADGAVVAQRIRDSAICEEVVAALDDWASLAEGEEQARLLRLAQRANPHPLRDRFCDPTVWQDPKKFEKLINNTKTEELIQLSPVLLNAICRKIHTRDATFAIPLFRAALLKYPRDFWLNSDLAYALYSTSNSEEAVGFFSAAIALRPAGSTYNNLSAALRALGRLDEAVATYRKAIELAPEYALAHFNLGAALYDQGNLDEAVAAYRKAIACNPNYVNAYNNLGIVLCKQRHFDKAEMAHREAMRLDPTDPKALTNLGVALSAQRRFVEAEAAHREAIRLDPTYAPAHTNLGNVLHDLGKLNEAVTAYEKAIAHNPTYAPAHYNLGLAHYAMGKFDKAVASYEKAIAHNPKDALAHTNLGNALRALDRLDEAEAAYRKAIRLDPRDALAYHNLGNVLHDLGKLNEAVTAYEKAIAHNPKDALAHTNLGNVLRDQRKLDEAETEHRKAIKLQWDCAEAYCDLGHTLQAQGKFAAAWVYLKLGRRLGLRNPNWTYREDSGEWLQECERLLILDWKLLAILKGKAQPADAAERLGLADLCLRYKQLYATSVRFYTEAFTELPQRADDLAAGHRYNAACAAVLTAARKGKDADTLDWNPAQLRQRALEWLKTELMAWATLVRKATPQQRQNAQPILARWPKAADLASVRDEKELAKLPKSEREDWQTFWADVDKLLWKIPDYSAGR